MSDTLMRDLLENERTFSWKMNWSKRTLDLNAIVYRSNINSRQELIERINSAFTKTRFNFLKISNLHSTLWNTMIKQTCLTFLSYFSFPPSTLNVMNTSRKNTYSSDSPFQFVLVQCPILISPETRIKIQSSKCSIVETILRGIVNDTMNQKPDRSGIEITEKSCGTTLPRPSSQDLSPCSACISQTEPL